jgi:hypothetical protein
VGEDPLSQAYLVDDAQLALIATQEITLAGTLLHHCLSVSLSVVLSPSHDAVQV